MKIKVSTIIENSGGIENVEERLDVLLSLVNPLNYRIEEVILTKEEKKHLPSTHEIFCIGAKIITEKRKK